MPLLARLRELLGYPKRVRAYGAETARAVQRNLRTVTHPLRPDAGMIACDALNLRIDPRRHEFLLGAMPILDRFAAHGARIERDAAGDPVFAQGDVRVRIENADDVGHLEEIFMEEVYGLAYGGDALVLDIGLNVGVAALYFAAVKGWEVVGYEPFPETAEAARGNVAASGLEGRIEVRNAAISDAAGTLTLPYDPEKRGRNSLFFDQAYGETLAATREVRIEDAAAVFREMRARAGGRALIVKMDCEGAEYPILDRLAAEGLLGTFEAVVLEYHPFHPGRGPNDLRAKLVGAGFMVHLPPGRPEGIGLMWAVRAAPGTRSV